MQKIIIIGGAGYVGTMLAQYLINEFEVTVYDLFIYGDHIQNQKVKKIKGDVRDLDNLKMGLKNQDIVVHLACISNDPSFDLNPKLAKSINYDFFEDLVLLSKDNGIKKFIYASSSSVYGVKDKNDVCEDDELKPLTEYSFYKAKCEEIILRHNSHDFITTILRPATVCGFSYRQRLDLIVNILTNHAYHNREILVLGGDQLRPNININDMCDAYKCIIKSDKNKVSGEIFNVGFENYSIKELANMVSLQFQNKIIIKYKKTDDNRSYHISSKKINNILNFNPKYNVEEGIKSLLKAFSQNFFHDPMNNYDYFNIKKMNFVNLK